MLQFKKIYFWEPFMKQFLFFLGLLGSVGLYASETSSTDTSVWLALFIIAGVAIFGLFFSSKQVESVKEEHSKMQQKQDEIIELQNEILTKMSHEIHNIVQDATKETQNIVLHSKQQDQVLKQALQKIVKSENKLLDITSDLLEFLQLKSNKIEIKKEAFTLINLLNDITGQVNATNEHIDFDLLYDIEEDVPHTVVGDTLYISKIAVNIIDYLKQNGSKSVLVKIKKEGSFGTIRLQIIFISDLTFDIGNDNSIFLTNYNEKTQQFEGLNLYVAKELAHRMDGELQAKNNDENHVCFFLDLPFKKAALPELITTPVPSSEHIKNKKILLIDKNQQCLEIDAKILKELGGKVDTKIRKEFNHNNFDFSNYDILIADAALFTTDFIKTLSFYNSLKIVAISSVFVKSYLDDFTDSEIKRPLTTSQIEDLFHRLYKDKPQKVTPSEQNILVHREKFAKTPNVSLESFADFEGSSLLIVEDNLINQKVLLSVLKKSNMDIDIANNGQEAVDMINKKKYDLVLMDINMPIMDGYTATLKIRENGFKALPIISLSALTSTDEINKMFDVGMNGYLAKPFYKERLYTVFNIFIKKQEEIPVLQPQKPQEIKELPKVEILDIKKGIELNKDDEIFYKEVLKEFQDAFGKSAHLYQKLIADFRYEQLRMLMVDLRGISSAIGASQIHELSLEILHLLLFKKFALLEDYTEKFQEEMDNLNHEINKYLS